MKRMIKTAALVGIAGMAFSTLHAGEQSGEALFEAHCAACHTTDLNKMNHKNTLIAPIVDEVMTHIKERFGKEKAKAISFMADYTLAPDPKKSVCASIEVFGLMPAQKGVVTREEAIAIAKMMLERYPRKAFTEQEEEGGEKHRGMRFEKLDKNKDGSITAREFQLFRAAKNHIDPGKFVNTYYFDRLDLNGDGKMDRAEFDAMKADKRKMRQQ